MRTEAEVGDKRPITGPTATTTAAYSDEDEEEEEEGSLPVEPWPRAGARRASIPGASPCPCANADEERGSPGGLARTLRRVSVMQLSLYPDGIITPPSPGRPSPGPDASPGPSPCPGRGCDE